MKTITTDVLQQLRSAYEADTTAPILHAALAKTDMAGLSYVPGAAARLKGAFFCRSQDERNHGPAEIWPLLAFCSPQYTERNRGRTLSPE